MRIALKRSKINMKMKIYNEYKCTNVLHAIINNAKHHMTLTPRYYSFQHIKAFASSSRIYYLHFTHKQMEEECISINFHITCK